MKLIVYSRVFRLLCVVGLLFQLFQVSQLYFTFQTTSKIKFEIPDVEDYQTIMYCPRYLDLVDRQYHEKYGILKQPSQSDPEIEKEMTALTVEQIFQLTPAVSDVIDYCILRSGNTFTPLFSDKKSCEDFFLVFKSVNGERICYTFMPRFRSKHSIGDIASSETFTNIVYQLRLNSKISNTNVALFVTSFMDPVNLQEPLNSRLFQRTISNSISFNRSHVYVYVDYISINRLPFPFDTKCTENHDREVCYEACLLFKLKRINRLPWSGFHRQAINMKLLTSFHLKNESMSKYMSETFQECLKECKLKSECYSKINFIIIFFMTDFTYSLSITDLQREVPEL